MVFSTGLLRFKDYLKNYSTNITTIMLILLVSLFLCFTIKDYFNADMRNFEQKLDLFDKQVEVYSEIAVNLKAYQDCTNRQVDKKMRSTTQKKHLYAEQNISICIQYANALNAALMIANVYFNVQSDNLTTQKIKQVLQRVDMDSIDSDSVPLIQQILIRLENRLKQESLALGYVK